jgi:hypothetical protein
MTKNILQLKHNEAKEFLLQEESYNTENCPVPPRCSSLSI